MLNKILVNQSQPYPKGAIYHDQMEFIQILQSWLKIQNSINKIHSNRTEEKNYKILLKDKDKTTWQFGTL